MIKVLHVIRSLGSGGAERQIVDLVKNTKRDKFHHTVVHFTGPNLFESAIRESGGEVICLDETSKHPWIAASHKINRLITSIQPDVIHCWLIDATMAVRLSRLSRRYIPTIVSLCCPDYEPNVIKMANWPRWKMLLLNYIDLVSGHLSKEIFVACSNYVRESARRQLKIKSARLRMIYNSVDPNSLVPGTTDSKTLRAAFQIPENAVLFVNVGRLDPQKGQEFLIRALHFIRSSAPSAFLAIAGEGGLDKTLKELVRELGLEDRVRFLGVSNEIGAWLEAADVFVFPSLFEGFGMALIEAMFKGLPVIASRVGPIPEILNDARFGSLVSAGNAAELGKAMLQLYEQPLLRREIGDAGKKNALERFASQVSIIPQWEALYGEMSPFSVDNGSGREFSLGIKPSKCPLSFTAVIISFRIAVRSYW